MSLFSKSKIFPVRHELERLERGAAVPKLFLSPCRCRRSPSLALGYSYAAVRCDGPLRLVFVRVDRQRPIRWIEVLKSEKRGLICKAKHVVINQRCCDINDEFSFLLRPYDYRVSMRAANKK